MNDRWAVPGLCEIIEWLSHVLEAREAVMRIHPKGLLVVAAFVVLVMLAVDVRLGIAAIVAATVVDWLSLALPLGLGRSRDHRRD